MPRRSRIEEMEALVQVRNEGGRPGGKHINSDLTTTIRFEGAVPQFTLPDLVRTTDYYRDLVYVDLYELGHSK